MCTCVPHLHSQQIHCFLFHESRHKKLHMSQPLLLHTHGSEPSHSAFLPITISDLCRIFPKISLSTCSLGAIPCRVSLVFCTTVYCFFILYFPSAYMHNYALIFFEKGKTLCCAISLATAPLCLLSFRVKLLENVGLYYLKFFSSPLSKIYSGWAFIHPSSETILIQVTNDFHFVIINFLCPHPTWLGVSI